MRSLLLALIAMLAGCDGRPATCDDQVPVEAPDGAAENVLLVLLDDIGVDQLAVYGAHPEPPPTPTLDRLSAEGVTFTRAYADPTCSPTRASILTGRRSRRTLVGHWLQPRGAGEIGLADEEISIAEVIADAGYASALVGKWHLSTFQHDRPELDPQRQGFASFVGLIGNPDMALYRDEDRGNYEHWERIDNGVLSWSSTYLTTAQVDDALTAIEGLPEPWFIVLSLSGAHAPWGPPPAELVPHPTPYHTKPDLYQEVVQALDTELGRLFASIDPVKLASTTVIVLGDNGTPEEVIRPPLDPDRSKETVYEGGIRVPLVVTGPRVTAPGSTSDVLVHAIDVFSTVADVAGVDLRELTDARGRPLAIDGRSFLPWIGEPNREGGRQCLLVEQFESEPTYWNLESAIVGERYKLTRIFGRKALYDLQHDGWDEGPDLLATELAPEAEEAKRALAAELRAYDRALP